MPQFAPEDERDFQTWYRDRARRNGLSLNPDDPEHHYDYRRAYLAGAEPDPVDQHWPSEFKAPDHPNRYVNGIDTITGKRMPGGNALNMLQQAVGGIGNALKEAGPAIASGAQAFHRGFDPEGAAQARQGAQARQKEQLSKTLAWLQQTKTIPEVERENWTMRNADAIMRDTGQDPRKARSTMAGGMGASPYADAELDRAIAAISAGLGQGPAQEEAYTLAPGAQRRVGSKVIAENPAAENQRPITARPGDVILSPKDADNDGRLDEIFSVNPEEKPPWPGAVKNAQGQWVYDENYLKGQQTLREAGKSSTNIYTGDLTKASETALQGKVLDATAVLSRLKGIEATFDPKHLTIPNQIANLGRDAVERLGGQLNPQDKAALQTFTTFKQNTMNNLNRTLQELSGAAVTPQEGNRIKQELPSMNDGPTAFKAKMDNAIQLQRAAIARQQYFLQNGIPLNEAIARQFPLEQFIENVASQGAPPLGSGQGNQMNVQGPPLDAEEQSLVEQLRQQGRSDAEIQALINGQ